MGSTGGITESYVLLGVVDQEVGSSKTSFSINKIGGHADFIADVKGTARCELCGAPQLLVSQIYCPLDSSLYHRTLYVFSCEKPACWSKCRGWTVLRLMSLDESDENKAEAFPTKLKPSETWDGGENDWGDEFVVDSGLMEENSKEINQALCQNLSQMSLVKSQKLASKCDIDTADADLVCTQNGSSFKSYHMNVFDEKECNEFTRVQTKYDCRQNIASSCNNDELSGFVDGCKIAPESYEPSQHKNKIFHKFWKYVDRYPEQAVRYSLNGLPVFANELRQDIPPCICGAARSFEMQLMPALIPYLKDGDVCIEFSTVLIYTCASNCGDLSSSSASLTREHIVYQDDPDLSYFKGQKTSNECS